MSPTVGDCLLERLRAWGVELVFGYPGDGINGLLAAWGRAEDRPRFIQARHEELAAFEATGYAKFSGRLGVCAATSGPGAVHLLNGLYDAKLDHVPVVALVGQTARSAYRQEVDLANLFRDVAHEYCQTVTVPWQLPAALDEAVRIALGQRTVTALIIPSDVQELEYSPPEHAFKAVPSELGPTRSRFRPPREELQRAADLLNAGDRVALLVGQGAREAREEVVETARILGAGVAKALLGRDVLPDDLPYVTGSIGPLGTRPSYELMMECDTLLTVGSGFSHAQFMPEPDRARAVQIELDPRLVGARYPYELSLVGDAAITLRGLIPLLKERTVHDWRGRIEDSVARWWRVVERQEQVDADPVNPLLVFGELSRRLPDRAVITADSGTAANWYARNLRFREDTRGALSGTLGAMGCAVPYAVGAKFAHPDRVAIAFAGDGAMQMNGLNELITVAKCRDRWEDPRLVVAVLNNGDLNHGTWQMRAMQGAPQFLPSQRLPDFPYAQYALGLGLGGIRVDNPRDIGAAWDAALAADRPFVLEFVTDPSVPPIPPHASWEQITDMVAAVVRSDPERRDVAREGSKLRVWEFLTGRGKGRDAGA